MPDWLPVMLPVTVSVAVMERGHPDDVQRQQHRRAAVARGDVEVREVTRRQLYIGGEPIGSTFD